MKKTFIALFAIAMIGGTVASCKKDKKVDCESAVKKFSEAVSAWQSNPSTGCAGYKAALQDYINSECFSSVSAELKAQYNEQLSALNCDAR